MKELKIIVSGTGSGGHIYPAIAISQAVQAAMSESSKLLFLGSKRGMECKILQFDYANLPHILLDIGVWEKDFLSSPIYSISQSIRGMRLCLELVDKWHPDVVIEVGGLAFGPLLFAGALRHVPSILVRSDIVPSRGTYMLAPLATKIAVAFPETLDFCLLPDYKMIVTGCPVRKQLWQLSRREARTGLDLQEDVETLLVIGGSSGSAILNRAISQISSQLCRSYQILHVVGCRGEDWYMNSRGNNSPFDPSLISSPALGSRYRLFQYLDREMMMNALVAADLYIGRAGASILAELAAAGLPSILIPFTHLRTHQDANANKAVELGFAVKLEEADIEKNPNRLLETIHRLMTDTTRRSQMADRARRAANPSAAKLIAKLALDAAAGSPWGTRVSVR